MKRHFQSGTQGVSARAAAAIVFILFAVGSTQAQIFHLQAGSSSLVNAHGGSIGFQAPGYEGAIGAGVMDGYFRFGGVLRTDFLGYKLTAGDDTLRFGLPTDIFNESQYFFGRGLGLSQKNKNTTWSFFGGTTSTIIGTPFFQAAKHDTPFGLFFLENRISPRLKFFSRSVISSKQTFINGFEYEVQPWLKTAISGGIGANARYSAISLVAGLPAYTIKAAYIDADQAFRRVSLEHPLSSEVVRENLSFDFHPNPNFACTISRQHYLAPLESTAMSPEALVNQVSVSAGLLGFRATTSLYDSQAEGQHNLGYLADISRPILRNLEAGFNFNRNEPELGKPSQTLGGRIRELFGRRFSLTQYASYSHGQTAFNFGGDFTSSRLSVSVSHGVTYAPFRPASAGGPFVNVYNVSLHIRLSQQLEVNAQSNVAPDGRVRYTTSVSNYLYRYAGLMQGEHPLPSSIGKYVVKGIVVDEQEHPIAGAAVRVGTEIAFTDSEGKFVVRLAKKGRESLRVSFEDFLTPTIYELVSAPSQVDVELEQDAKTVVVILRRVVDREKFQQIRSELLAKQQNSTSRKTTEAPDAAAPATDGDSSSSSRSIHPVRGGGGELPQH